MRLILNIMGLSGIAAIVAGVAVIHWPSSLITGGAFALLLGVIGVINDVPPTNPD